MRTAPSTLPYAGAQVFILHGYLASPGDHWFPWLRDALQAQGAQVIVLSPPEPAAPEPARWDAYLQQALPPLGPDTVLIAHSLGGIALLRHLQHQPAEAPLGALLLVSGFDTPLPSLPQLDAFTDISLDYARLQTLAPGRALLAAADDAIVPASLSVALAERLDAPITVLPNGGHFLGSEGVLELPAAKSLLDQLRSPHGGSGWPQYSPGACTV